MHLNGDEAQSRRATATGGRAPGIRLGGYTGTGSWLPITGMPRRPRPGADCQYHDASVVSPRLRGGCLAPVTPPSLDHHAHNYAPRCRWASRWAL
jgi:hypothetical protein